MSKKSKCFICGNPANIKHGVAITVRCENCDAFYEFEGWIKNKRIDSETGLFTYFNSKTKSLIPLKAPQKKKLLDYIHKYQKPAELDPATYENLVDD